MSCVGADTVLGEFVSIKVIGDYRLVLYKIIAIALFFFLYVYKR